MRACTRFLLSCHFKRLVRAKLHDRWCRNLVAYLVKYIFERMTTLVHHCSNQRVLAGGMVHLQKSLSDSKYLISLPGNMASANLQNSHSGASKEGGQCSNPTYLDQVWRWSINFGFKDDEIPVSKTLEQDSTYHTAAHTLQVHFGSLIPQALQRQLHSKLKRGNQCDAAEPLAQLGS